MKAFSKLFAGLAVAGLILAGCSGATTTTTTVPEDTTSSFPITFDGDTIPDTIYSKAGSGNSATVPALELTTPTTQEVTGAGRYYLKTKNADGKVWPVTMDLGAHTAQVTLRSDTDSSNNVNVELVLSDLKFGSLSGKTGLQFRVNVPQTGGNPTNTGLLAYIRNTVGTDENNVVFEAPIGDPTAEDFSTYGQEGTSVSDWFYYADDTNLWFDIKVPFDCFNVPGWAPSATNTYDTIADAIDAGVKFNQINIVFRMAMVASGLSKDTNYSAFIDNVTLY